MKTQTHSFLTTRNIGLITVGLLLIPFIAMQFSTGVDWSISDFAIMGLLIFGTGMAFKWTFYKGRNLTYKAGVVLAIGTSFLLVWVDLAVGLIASGPNVPNLLFLGVVAVVIIGSVITNLQSKGMMLTMFLATMLIGLIGLVAIVMEYDRMPGNSWMEVLGVTGFFGMLYLIAGFLFRANYLSELKEK